MIRVPCSLAGTTLSSLLLGLATLSAWAATPQPAIPVPVVVVDYHLISKTPVHNSSLYDFVYRVDVKNTTSDALVDVVGSVTSKRKSVQIMDGQASFGTVDALKVRGSTDTITVRANKFFDRRLDRKVTRGGRLEFEEDGSDPEDARIPGWPAKWTNIVDQILDDLFRLKGRFVFEWKFTFKQNQDQTGPVITGQAPTGNVASDRPPIQASYQDPSGINTASVKLVVDGADVTSRSQVTASGVSFTPATALGQGAHTVTLSVADTAGNASSANWSFSVDSLAPVVSGQSPRDTQSASPRSTIAAQYADAGTGIDLSKTVLIVDGQDVTPQAAITATGVTYTRATPLANGGHDVTLRVADALGNQTESRWTFGVDGTGPDITGTSPKDVTFPADARPTLAATFGDSGAGVDVASVRLALDGADVTTSAQVTASGLSYTPAAPLAERLHAVRVTVKDRNGNATDVQWGFTTRTDPTISDAAPTDSLLGAGAPVVVSARYGDVGSGIDTAAVKLLVDGADVTSHAVVSDTAITLIPGAPLADGLHVVILTVADKAGNAAAQTWRFTTDTGLPVVTASAPKDTLIGNAAPAITASYQDSPGGSGIDVASVRVSVDGADVTAQAQVTATGASYTPPAALSGGAHAVAVHVADLAGNAVESSWSFAVDADGPAITDTTPADTTLPADARPEVTARLADRGQAGIDPASIHLRVDGTDVTAQATLAADRITWTPSQPLFEGRHTVELAVADALGNAATANWQFVTATPPVISGEAPKDLFLSERSAPVISASFSDVGSGIDGARTALVVDGVDVTSQATASDAGILYPAPAAAAGSHSVRLAVFDRAGNHAESAWQFGVSTAPRILSFTPEGALPAGTVAIVAATYEDAAGPIDPSRVRLYVDGENVSASAVVTATSLQYTPTPALAPGAHVASLSVLSAQNLSAVATSQFVIAAPPVHSVQVLSPASGTTVTSHTVEVEARAFSDAADVVRVLIGGVEVPPRPTTDQGTGFSRVVALNPGDNAVPVQADFADGQSRTTSVDVAYDAPPAVAFTSPADLDILGPVMSTSPRDLTGNVERPVTILGTLSKPVVSVTVNQQQAEVTGLQFSFPTFFLHEGTNLVSAVATDARGATGSASITIFVDQTAPLLTIEAPTTSAVTSGDRIDVRGIVNDAVEGDVRAPNPAVTVANSANGQTVTARVADRFFLAPDVPLEVGINVVSVTATDHVGNARTQELRVSRVAVGSSRLTILSGNRQRGPVNARLGKALTVLAIDQNGNPLAGLPISFDVMRGTGALDAEGGSVRRNVVVATDASGTAKVFLTLGKQSGEAGNMVRASHESIAEDVAFTATGERGLPALIQAEGSGAQYAEAGTQPLDALSVIVYDEERNPVPDVSVTFRIDEGDAAFDGNAPTLVKLTDKGGRAVARPRLGRDPGTVRVSAKASAPTSDGTSTVEVDGASFEVISLPPSDGPTTFVGIVLDHKGTPLPGVRLSIGRTNLSATSGADGRFAFESDVPPGKLDLFVDGRFVTNGSGQQYPSLHFAAVAVRGQRNTLPHAIYLPPLLMSEARVVGGAEDVTLTIPGFDGFAMVVKANSVTFPDGSTVGPLVVSPVNLEKLPMVPPGGSTTFMAPAWTVQPSGTRFDPPIEVHIPNSLALKPGETRDVYQWDHDLATFVPMGRATVSEDGAELKTDPGSGITKAGWGGGNNNNNNNCGTGADPKCKDCQVMKTRTSGNCPVKSCEPDYSKNQILCRPKPDDPNSEECGRCFGGACDTTRAFDSGTTECCGGKKADPDKYCCIEFNPNAFYKRVERGKKISQPEVAIKDYNKCSNRQQATDDRAFLTSSDAFGEEVCPQPRGGGFMASGMDNEIQPGDGTHMPNCVDGCSVPEKLTAFGGFIVISDSGHLNNQDPTQGLDKKNSPTSFYPACKAHDLCYQTCGSDRGQCDQGLHQGMRNICLAAPADQYITYYPAPVSGDVPPPPPIRMLLREACLSNADTYNYFLGKFGQTAYDNRQRQWCDCCPKAQ